MKICLRGPRPRLAPAAVLAALCLLVPLLRPQPAHAAGRPPPASPAAQQRPPAAPTARFRRAKCDCRHLQSRQLLAAVQACYAARTLTAEFEQTYVDAALGPRPSESGTLAIDAQGRLRFAYVQPEAKEFLFDGRRAAMVEPLAKQVTVLDHFAGSQACQALSLLTGASADRGLLKLVAAPAPTCAGPLPAAARLDFVPSRPPASWRSGYLSIERNSCEIAELGFSDLAGNATRYRLTRRRFDEDVRLPGPTYGWPADYSVLHADGGTPSD